MTTMWIGPDEELELGQKGFLVEHSNSNTGSEFYVLRDTPAHTNQSHEPKLHGWCGSYNNVSTHGRGAWRVVRVAKNGRALIEELRGQELVEMLDEFGYPELAPEA